MTRNPKNLLMVGAPTDPVLMSLQRRLKTTGIPAEIIDNLACSHPSIALEGTVSCKSFRIRGKPIDVNDTVILVGELRTLTSSSLTPMDAEYVRHECHAVWLAFLIVIPCRVINRPSLRYPRIFQSSILERCLARSLEIPTLSETLTDGRATDRLEPYGAYIDLSTSLADWQKSNSRFEPGRIYSLVRCRELEGFTVIVRIVGAAAVFYLSLRSGKISWNVKCDFSLINSSRILFDAFGISYGYCTYAISNNDALFARISTMPPPGISEEHIESISRTLRSELGL